VKDYAEILEEAEWDGWLDAHDNSADGVQRSTATLIGCAYAYARTIGSNPVQIAQIQNAYQRGYLAAQRSNSYAAH